MSLRSTLFMLLGMNLASAAEYSPEEVLLKSSDDTPILGKVIVKTEDVRRIKLPKGVTVGAALKYYRQRSDVAWVEPNYVAHTTYTPNDPYYTWGAQWGLATTRCSLGWDLTQGNSDVTIAIVDTGVDLDHWDLQGKLVPGYDFVNYDAVPDDDNGHGTHCAGIAGAATNNGAGIAGVAPLCKIMPVKVMGADGSGYYSDIAEGIRFAADQGAKIISLSLAGDSSSYTLQAAIDYAISKNVTVIAAAGNKGSDIMMYPGAYEPVLCVGATNRTDGKPSWSNYGSWVDVMAPGDGILSTHPFASGGITGMSGTSMAAPLVAGIAGLIYSLIGGSATPKVVRDLIEDNSVYVGPWCSHGRVDTFASLNAYVPPPIDYYVNLEPKSHFVLYGVQQNGTLDSLKVSDNLYMDIKGYMKTSTFPVDVQTNFDVDSIVPAKDCKATIELSSNYSGTADLLMYSYSTNSWMLLNRPNVGTTDTTVEVVIPNYTDYVSPTGEIRLRLKKGLGTALNGIQPRGGILPSAPKVNHVVKFDFVHLTLRR